MPELPGDHQHSTERAICSWLIMLHPAFADVSVATTCLQALACIIQPDKYDSMYVLNQHLAIWQPLCRQSGTQTTSLRQESVPRKALHEHL